MPGSSSGNEKLPCSLVVALRVALVRSLRILTVATGTAAPLGSVTVPVIRPVVFCADAVGARNSRAAKEIAPSISANQVTHTPNPVLFTGTSLRTLHKFGSLRLLFLGNPVCGAFNGNTLALSSEKYRYSKGLVRRILVLAISCRNLAARRHSGLPGGRIFALTSTGFLVPF